MLSPIQLIGQQSGVIIYYSGLSITKNNFPVICISNKTLNEKETYNFIDSFNRIVQREIDTTIISLKELDLIKSYSKTIFSDITDTVKHSMWGSITVRFFENGKIQNSFIFNESRNSKLYLNLLTQKIAGSDIRRKDKLNKSISRLLFELNNPKENDDVVLPCFIENEQFFNCNYEEKKNKNDTIPLKYFDVADSVLLGYFNRFQIDNFIQLVSINDFNNDKWFKYQFRIENTEINTLFCFYIKPDLTISECFKLPKIFQYADQIPYSKTYISNQYNDLDIIEVKFDISGIKSNMVWRLKYHDKKINENRILEVDIFTDEVTCKYIE